ncbi:TPA: hypothetical protein ACX6QL_003832 [Photobacterium damselae]|uniref:hypothetical protein n=1 Tax=Photobacterium damselae TaxID=38293 RepID=UPI001592EA24|nr:hypothetical protein [Photobacterium damselae]NVH52894.1 hypothetical protein [Photobacterium damselae subsp. damselae]NVO80914.1 hypothetical protein [Photobacterium damselae subsp. damselae]
MELETLRNQILQRVGCSAVDNLKMINTHQGHGFAAEEMNHFIDVVDSLSQLNFSDAYNAEIIGGDLDPATNKIIKSGADRFYKGDFIQSKYCKSGSKCISACIDSDGSWKYKLADGRGFQKIEVPSDKYDEAVRNLDNRIRTGKVKGISDPAMAKKLIVKGFFTHDQAKRVTEFFTPESLLYDAASGMIVSGGTMLISGVISFAIAIWSGCDTEQAFNNALDIALKVGGIAFATHMVSSQLSKSLISQSIKSSSVDFVKSDIFKTLSKGSITKLGGSEQISNRISKNSIAAIATVVVLSAVELAKFLSSKISGSQAFKNIVVMSVSVAASVAGGQLGLVAGAKLGLATGNPWCIVVGAIAGGISGFLAGNATKSIMDNFIEDDAIGMLRIFERAIGDLATDYLLGNEEIQNVILSMRQNQNMSEFLAFMYYAEKKSGTAYSVAYVIAEYEVSNILSKRKKVEFIDNNHNALIDAKISNLVCMEG